jgi:homoserine O-succinyltransferase
MPLVINGGHIPEHWAQDGARVPLHALASQASANRSGRPSLKIALVNNMPDAALEDTEAQFFSLLDGAAGDICVDLALYSLPDVPRGERVEAHLANFYRSTNELLHERLDGAIITGTEPRQRNLRDEPYWANLAAVFDWAAECTTSAVLSCLAAHASVLHSDGIDRNPLPDKQFGVFAYQRIGSHPLTAGLPPVVRFPHSRWNEVRPESLAAHGYDLLDGSADDGVNLFVRQTGQSLFVHFQGHPEYAPHTLLKEYRRDIRRFLKQERSAFPSLPQGYFAAAAETPLAEFRRFAEDNPVEDSFAAFPEDAITRSVKNSWQNSARTIYSNWLQLILSQRAATSHTVPLAPAYRG